MKPISQVRRSDIWGLNATFLRLCGRKVIPGVDHSLCDEIGTLSSEELDAVSQTDVLLFSVDRQGESGWQHEIDGDVESLLEQLGTTCRDVSLEDVGLATARLGVDAETIRALVNVRVADAKDIFLKSKPSIRPLGGTTQFRILRGLRNPSERTQYAILAANN